MGESKKEGSQLDMKKDLATRNKEKTLRYISSKQKRVAVNWLKSDFEENIMPAIRLSEFGSENGDANLSGFIKAAVREKIERDGLDKKLESLRESQN